MTTAIASFSGMFSGIDTDALVNATMTAEQAPLTNLQTQKTNYQNKITALDNIKSPMTDLETLVSKLKDLQSLRAVTATSSDSNSVAVSATTGASEGTHQIVVGQLASAERQVQAGVDPTEAWTATPTVASSSAQYLSADDISDASGANHNFVFQFGGEAKVSVDLSAYDTTGISLDQLVSAINSAAGYTAATAAQSGGQYMLRLQAQNSGSGHALTITNDNSVSALSDATDFTQTVNGSTGTDALVGAGTFVYTYNGVTRTVTSTANTNLGQLRDLINNDGGNPGVTASVLQYAGATGGQYHLVLSGQDTGANYTITVDSATTLSGFGPGDADWTKTQAAQNSRIRVDGYPDGAWIENSGNVVTSAIPDVTLTLLQPTTSGQDMAANSSNTSVLAAWANAGASPGTHEIEVNQLAAAGRQAQTSGLASADTTVGAGTFEYQYDGVTRSLATDGTTTLTQLASLINDDTQNPGLTASVLDYGGQYHLVLDGQETGSTHDITITDGTTLTGFQASDFTATAARNAQFKVNGFPPGADDWIERDSNTIDDAVPGATVTLQGLGTAQVLIAAPQAGQDDAVTVNLARNTDQLHTDLQTLATTYNTIADLVTKDCSYDATTQTAGVMIGDTNLELLLSNVRSLFSMPVPGFDAQKDTDSMISQVGLEVDKDGHLSVDDTTFNNAVASNYTAMLNLIGDEGVGSSDSSFVQFNATDTTTTAGAYEVQVDYNADGTISAARIRTQGEGDDAWRAATVDGNQIVGAKGNPEQWLQLTATADPSKAGTAYTQDATVDVKRGFAGALYQQLQSLLDPTTGPIAIKETEYQSEITALNTEISDEQARLAKMEKDLKAKYAAMETTLSQLDSLRAGYQALNASLGYGMGSSSSTPTSSGSSSSSSSSSSSDSTLPANTSTTPSASDLSTSTSSS